MYVSKFETHGFRNLCDIRFSPCKETNIIYGKNAQGKTNLLEAIWLFSGISSFRGAKDAELKSFNSEKAKIKTEFFSDQRMQTAEINIENHRKYTLNGVELKSASEMCESCHFIVFSPDHLSIIKEGPRERRKFLNTAISEIYGNYTEILKKYNRVIKQRNSILKELKYKEALYLLLEDYDEAIANYGAKIIHIRKRFIEKLMTYLPGIYEGLTNKKEKIEINYLSTGIKNSTAEELLYQLKEKRVEDTVTGTTSIGPHRDDIEFLINGINARSYGSQGQQRSVILALKLAEAEIIKAACSEQPIALLDDVMSELDPSRQDYILNHIKNWQVFITCCEPSSIERLNFGKTYKMENGVLTEENVKAR